MKNTLFKILFLISISALLYAQSGYKEINKTDADIILTKPTDIEDRAGGTHNAGNIGLFFENRGKLYPRRLTQGPAGEFPINSGKNYIYRINPIVAVPGNVIQGRFTSNEEWEAVGGYQNPDFTKICFSDNPKTWHPDLGWPVKDAEGNNIIMSDQDSYCVFNDLHNGVKRLNITVVQTGYSYGVSFAQNLLFFKYDIINNGDQKYDSLYFAMYTDIDIGNVSGGVPEYADDFIQLDKQNNFLYFYDDGASPEWPGGTTGQFGIALLKTPEKNGVQLGITDMHYNEYYDDRDIDDIQFTIISSDTSFLEPKSLFNRYFHLGPQNDIHFDDPGTIAAGGMDIVATISSGPYTINPGDTLTFQTVLVAGNNNTDLYESLNTAYRILDFDFEVAKPPATPNLSALSSDEKVVLFWDDLAENSFDNFANEYDFEGYRIYKSVDKGVHWDQYDRNVDPYVGIEPVPLADFDIINNYGVDSGLKYSFIDTNVTNGFEYWYSVTAYDRGSELIESLECARGSNTDALNTVSIIPESRAINRVPVHTGDVVYTGMGKTNYEIDVKPGDLDSLADNQYHLGFTYSIRRKGSLNTQIRIVITDSTKTMPYDYSFNFLSINQLEIVNMTLDEVVGPSPRFYISGPNTYYSLPGMRAYIQDPDPNADPVFLPKEDDQLFIDFSVVTALILNENTGKVNNSVIYDTLTSPRSFKFNEDNVIPGGILFAINKPDIIQNVIREAGNDDFSIDFSVSDEDDIKNNIYFLSVEGNGFDNNNGFISLLIRDSAMTVIDSVDTLYNNDEIYFNGISALIQFPSENPPHAGNVFSLTSIVPAAPNLLDSWTFSLNKSKTDNTLLKQELDNIKVVPNPYIAASLYEEEFGELRREPIRKIKFINLPQICDIYVFTVAGDLVTKLNHNDVNGTYTWDLRSDGGREIAPGIYIYVVKANGKEYINRFAVIK